MSYNISFRVKVEGVETWIDTGTCDANITWNVRDIITRSTGLPWVNEIDNGLVMDIIPCIEKGRLELMSNPKKYKRYEAKNGWGTVDDTIAFFDRILRCWDDFVRDYEELADVVTFWIT